MKTESVLFNKLITKTTQNKVVNKMTNIGLKKEL